MCRGVFPLLVMACNVPINVSDVDVSSAIEHFQHIGEIVFGCVVQYVVPSVKSVYKRHWSVLAAGSTVSERARVRAI